MDVGEALARAVDDMARRSPRVLVAIDGPDAAGKTTLADSLAAMLTSPTLRASIDRFHRPRAERLARGPLSPEGYFRDSFDDRRLVDELLAPFANGDSDVLTAAYDWRVESDVVAARVAVPDTCVLVFDGVFLLRPELLDLWDLSIYLHVPPDVTLQRALVRDAGVMGGVDEVRQRYAERYLPGQAMYREECDPMSQADVVIDNSRPQAPEVVSSAFDLR